jgi:hypothetical protein
VIRQLCATARNVSFKELWVYTGREDDIAPLFYVRIGFEVLGAASNYAPGKTMDDSDIVLRRILAAALTMQSTLIRDLRFGEFRK